MIATMNSALQSFRPSNDAIFGWLSGQIADPLIDKLALSDLASEEEAVQVSKQLRVLLRNAKSPNQISEFIAFEELSLERWRKPEEGSFGTLEENHLIHAFSCACLLLAATESGIEEYILSENETLIQLVRSVIYLGDIACVHAQSLIAWRLLHYPGDPDENPFFGVALLILALGTGAEEECLPLLCDWVISEVARVRSDPDQIFPKHKESWLFGLTFFNQHEAFWRCFVRTTLLDPPAELSAVAAKKVRDLGERILQSGG